VVIEECLFGEEASFIVMVDGEHVLPLATSQDHKRLLDGDLGPNTGGMGAYSPAPVVTPELHAKAMREVIRPVVAGMKADGMPFTGFLYAGLMISPDGQIKVLEFNCRMGDPETQPIMMRLKSDLVTLLEAAVEGRWTRSKPNGIAAPRWAWCWPRRLSGRPEEGRASSARCRPRPTTCMSSTPAPASEDGRTVVSGGRVLA
jgi:phosphoribosylamine---glycine ligase